MSVRAAYLALLVILGAAEGLAQETWQKDIGKEAPPLFAAGWAGTPVSLDSLRRSGPEPAAAGPGTAVEGRAGTSGGNTVVLAFWNADIPC